MKKVVMFKGGRKVKGEIAERKLEEEVKEKEKILSFGMVKVKLQAIQ